MTYPLGYSKIIGIAGQIGSGKTSFARELSVILNAKQMSFGDYVRLEASKQNIPPDRFHLQELGEQLITEYGYIGFVNNVLEMGTPHPLIIIDGIRHVQIWEAIEFIARQSILIYLDISNATRLQRLIQRDNLPKESVEKAMEHSMEKNITLLKSHADLVFLEIEIKKMVEITLERVNVQP